MSRSLFITSAIAIGFTLSAPVAAQPEAPSGPEAESSAPDVAPPNVTEADAPAGEATAAPDGSVDTISQAQAEPTTDAAEGKSTESAKVDAQTAADDEPTAETQEEPEEPYDGPATLLDGDGEKMHIGGYGGLAVLGTSINKGGGLLVGGEGALLLDHRLAIGVAGYGLASESGGPDFANGDASILGFGYGGAVFRYHIVSKKSPVTASLGALIGAGGLTLIDKVSSQDFEYEYDYRDDTPANVFFIAEPSAQVNLHLTKWMRFGVSGGYRLVRGPSLGGISDSDLEGVTAGAHAQFGWF